MTSNGNFYNKPAINTFIALFATGTSVLLATAIVPVIVLSLGTESWARYAFFLLYVAALQCVEAGLQSYTLQMKAIANSTGGRYEWRSDRALRTSMLWLALAAFVAISANHALGAVSDREMRALLSLAIVNVFPRAFCAVLKGNMMGQQSQAQYYLVTSVFNVGRPLFLLLCLGAVGVRSEVTLALLYVSFSVFELTVLWRLLERDRARQVAPAQQAVSEPYFLPAIIAANLMSTLSTNVDKILAYGSLSLRVLGEYTFAAQIAALLNLFVSSAVAAFSPRFRELYILGDYSQIRRVFMLLSALNNFLVVTAAALFLTNGEFFLSVFKGHIDREALLGTFAILAGAAFISSNLWFPGAIATSTGKPYFSLFTNIGFMAGYLCAFLLLRSRLDDSVFALSMLCAASMTTAAGLVYFKLRVLDFSLLRYGLATVALPILIVVATYVLPALVIKSHFGGNLPGLAFAAAWLVTLLPVAFRGRHLLALRRQHAS